MRPGRSLLAESECMSGKVLRSGSETLELVSGQKQEETCCQRVVTPTRPPEGALEEEKLDSPHQPMHTHLAHYRHRQPLEVGSSLSDPRAADWHSPASWLWWPFPGAFRDAALVGALPLTAERKPV